MRKHATVLQGLLSIAFAVLMPLATAQPSPNAPIKFVVPTSPGSVADIAARLISESMQTISGRYVILDNRLGAGGSLAARAVANAPPDGLTIGILAGTYLLYPFEFPGIAFDPRVDLVAVAMVGRAPNVLIVLPNSPYASLKSLIDDARARPSQITYASAGVGSSTFWSAERLRLATNVELTHVPYKGSPEVMNEVLSGRVAFAFVPAAVAMQMVGAGKLKVLAVSSVKRSSLLPDVPTTLEAGYPGSAYEGWLVATVPKGTSRETQQRLNRQFLSALGTPDVTSKLTAQGLDPELMGLEAVQTFVAKQYEEAMAMANASKSKVKQ